mgnify:CR=1 FL=1
MVNVAVYGHVCYIFVKPNELYMIRKLSSNSKSLAGTTLDEIKFY